MSWLEFIVRMTSALAWPLVAGGAMILLRKQIRTAADKLVERVDKVVRLKFPGGSIDFKDQVRDLAATTAAETAELAAATPDALPTAQPAEVVLPPETADERLTKYRELAVLDPRAAILLAFTDVESAIRQRFRQLHPDQRSASFGRIIEVLYNDGLLDDEIVDALRRMSEIRNQVAHEQTALDLDVANYFVESAGNVFGYLLLSDFFGDNPTSQS